MVDQRRISKDSSLADTNTKGGSFTSSIIEGMSILRLSMYVNACGRRLSNTRCCHHNFLSMALYSSLVFERIAFQGGGLAGVVRRRL
jgi:hypothetical protein